MPEPRMLPLGEVTLVDHGTGPALLLLHGNGRTWQDWRPQLQTLTDRFRCIAYDQRGFGQPTLNWDLLPAAELDEGGLPMDRAALATHERGRVTMLVWHLHAMRR